MEEQKKDLEKFELVVIGSGPSGQKAAQQAAKLSKTVALVEVTEDLGGHCLQNGTLPSKSFRESVYRWSLSSRGSLSMHSETSELSIVELPSMERLLKRKNNVVDYEALVVRNQLQRNGVRIYTGHARLEDQHTVKITHQKKETKIHADNIVIATGSRPVSPDFLPIDGKVFFDNTCILNLKEVPKTLAVLGAGIIGCEYASMFATAGTKVFLIDKREDILGGVDREIVENLKGMFSHQGMSLHLGVGIDSVQSKTHGVEIKLQDGTSCIAEKVLVSKGRKGNVENLGLEKLSIPFNDRGLIEVDEKFQTKVKNIYAVGDVIGSPALASTGMEQGRKAACYAFGVDQKMMPEQYPYGIYTIPEISLIGESEDSLKQKKVPYVCGKARFAELARGQIVGDHWGMLKLMVCAETQKILGIHILGDNASDLIHTGQAVMKLGGTLQYFLEEVFNYPTMAEAYKTAAYDALNQIRGWCPLPIRS